MQILHKQKSNW